MKTTDLIDRHPEHFNILVSRYAGSNRAGEIQVAVRYKSSPLDPFNDIDVDRPLAILVPPTGKKWDPEAINTANQKGAFCNVHDLDGIRKAVADLKAVWGDIHVQDNTGLVADINNGFWRDQPLDSPTPQSRLSELKAFLSSLPTMAHEQTDDPDLTTVLFTFPDGAKLSGTASSSCGELDEIWWTADSAHTNGDLRDLCHEAWSTEGGICSEQMVEVLLDRFAERGVDLVRNGASVSDAVDRLTNFEAMYSKYRSSGTPDYLTVDAAALGIDRNTLEDAYFANLKPAGKRGSEDFDNKLLSRLGAEVSRLQLDPDGIKPPRQPLANAAVTACHNAAMVAVDAQEPELQVNRGRGFK